ncbi:MAG: hypothetical protein GEV10_04890 [Streptosporangiales bacterium]|nr:hypothetical protein [Streptosporangiales bacterium]
MPPGPRLETNLLCLHRVQHGHPVSFYTYKRQPVIADRPAEGKDPAPLVVKCQACRERVRYRVLSVGATRWARRIWALAAIGCVLVAALSVAIFVKVVVGFDTTTEPGVEYALIPVGFVVGLCFSFLFLRMAKNDPGARGPGVPVTFSKAGHKLEGSVF